MRRAFVSFLILLTTLLVCNTPTIIVQADTGPKPSLNIQVIGIEGEYYLDLLVEKGVDTFLSGLVYDDISATFLEYADTLRVFRNADTHSYWILDGRRPMVQGENLALSNADSVIFNYMVPLTFRVVIIKKNKDIIITNKITRKQFNSNMVLDLTNNVSLIENETSIYEFTGSIVEIDVIKDNILGFLYRLFITLFVELFIAIFFFKIRKKQAIQIIVIVNILTQILLNIILFNYSGRSLNTILYYGPIFINLELLIICFETWIYLLAIKGYKVSKLICYGILANLVTAILTFIV